MTLSIITVTFNSAATLAETFASVAAQTYRPIEYIIVDGGSSDATMDLVRANPMVTRSISERDRGIYDAMNKGVRMATGDVIGILNSDDVYADEEVLTKVMDAFRQNPALDALYGDISYFRTEEPNKVARLWRSTPYRDDFFDRGHVPPHPSLFVRKRVYDAIGGYHPEFKISSDYEFMLRMLKLHGYQSLYLPITLVRMRLGGASTAGWRAVATGNREVVQSWRMNGLRVPPALLLWRQSHRIWQLLRR